MANEAHKEPTMEEILASIRKIIADDGPATSAPARPPLREVSPASSSTRGFSFDGDGDDLGMFEGEDAGLGADLADDIAEEVAEEFTTEFKGPEYTFEAMLGASKARDQQTSAQPPAPEPVVVPEPAPPAPQPVLTSAPPAPQPEPKMPAAPRYAHTPLTEANTAESAAGALGKLISKMDIGSDNTLEGLVREMLRPMLKEWLDANLSRIVEEKVEAEVQRIGRMAR